MSVKINEKQRMFVFINLMITGIATSMLATAMTTALPPVVEYFGISMTTGQWMTSGYSLAMGIVMPLTAFLIKKISTRKLYISSIVCFIIGELVCILAPGFGMMMVGRVLQAIGNGILTSMGQVIILSIYPEEKKGAMMGWYGLAATAAPIIAPTIAGVLVDTVGWKYIFIYTMVIMIVSLIMSVINFRDVLELQDIDFDMISFVLSIFAFGGITLGIGNIGSYGMASLMSGVPLLIGICGAVFFVMRQLKLEKAFLDIRILKNKEYSLAVIFNVIRNVSIGCLMMPLLTWGTNQVAKEKVADASSLLTSLRTVAGSIGSAVFVAIMSAVAISSESRYGAAASMHGVNIAFVSMSISTLIMVGISIFGVKKKA